MAGRMAGRGGAEEVGAADRVRLDVWLWRARFCKTRAAAQTLIGAGRVRVGRHGAVLRVEKAHFALAPGDRLSLVSPRGALVLVEVAAVGVRRGPPAEARTLYRALGPDGAPGEGDDSAPAARHPAA